MPLGLIAYFVKCSQIDRPTLRIWFVYLWDYCISILSPI